MKLKYPYAEKGCSHCSGNNLCSTEDKRSRETMLDKPRVFRDAETYRRWESRCAGFTRDGATEMKK